ncbi:L,D-transpeptidase family protein [Shewanella sp. GXUN23E]|uniref:L,D-transpeptidase family protein n=1 Tax=Shewanella sp. GXUN23E TaxID=3422498 RepID=UPI003D7E9B5F
MRCLGLILMVWLSSMQVSADDSQALDNFERHLRLLSLADDSGRFLAYSQLFYQSSDEAKLAHMDDIILDMSLFWQQHGQPAQLSSEVTDRLARALAVEPKVKDYLWVTNRIRYLDWLVAQNDWPRLPGKVWLRPGDQHPDVALLARRLKQLGDLASGWQGSTLYDETLSLAVKRFQQRHGLEPDAVIGPRTLYWLNLPPQDRAQLLAKNFVERTSYSTRLGDRYLLVNIPAYELKLVDGGLPRLHSRVIVGSPYRQTPVMHSQISNLILNPNWNVPRKLVYRDIRPKVLADGHYLAERGFDIFDFEGHKLTFTPEQLQQEAATTFPYRLVQRPGEKNALGRYKFHFANNFSVYLHDTPDKALFNRADRALSSGCIRVERVDALANWFAANLVMDKQTWVARVNAPGFETQWFALSDVLPIHLVYWTAWMQGPDKAQFRNDIYHKFISTNELSAGLK